MLESVSVILSLLLLTLPLPAILVADIVTLKGYHSMTDKGELYLSLSLYCKVEK